jgi:cysteine desulfurase
MSIYLDCNATSPVEPRVQEEVMRYLSVEFGNAGSRTHDFGARANAAVQRARSQIALVIQARTDEVIFTSGATEGNNIAILGLARHGERTARKHIVSTTIEHKAVLEPLEALEKSGFDLTLVPPTHAGYIDPASIASALRPDTLLVSMMHVNNETGVIQPVSEVANILKDHQAFLHVDAAQGFGKDIEPLCERRIDFISISGHKIYAPMGVGALVVRRRGFTRPPLSPLLYGGGQERGLRPGTLPVPLIVGLGLAAEMAVQNVSERARACLAFRERALTALVPLQPIINGDPNRTLPHVINMSFPGVDSEALMLSLKDHIAISNGSACTSHKYQPSHVLKAMGIQDALIKGAVRISWCHMTGDPDWDSIVSIIKGLQ